MLVDYEMANFGSTRSFLHLPSNTNLPQQISPSFWLGSLGDGHSSDGRLTYASGAAFLKRHLIKIIISCQYTPDAVRSLKEIASQSRNPIMCFIVDPSYSSEKLRPDESLSVLNFISEYQPKLNQMYLATSTEDRLNSPIITADSIAEVLFKVTLLIEYMGSKFPQYPVLVLTDKTPPASRLLLPLPFGDQSDNELSMALVLAYLCHKFNLTVAGAFGHLLGARPLNGLLLAHPPLFESCISDPQIKDGILRFYEESLAVKIYGGSSGEGQLKRLAPDPDALPRKRERD